MKPVSLIVLCYATLSWPATAAAKDAATLTSFPLACFTFEQDLDRHENCARRDGSYVRVSPERVARLDFHDGPAQMAIAGIGWIWVRGDGLALPVFTLDNGPDPFEQGLVRGWWNGKVAFFDSNLTLVLATPFDWAFPFNERGEALVCRGCRSDNVQPYASMVGGEWAVIDRSGQIVVPLSKTKAAVERYSARP